MIDREIDTQLKSDIGVGASKLMGNLIQVGVAIITTETGRPVWISNQAHPLSPEGLVGVMVELTEVKGIMRENWPGAAEEIDWLKIDGSHNQDAPPPTTQENLLDG